MNVEIYDGQHGAKIYPNDHTINEKIKKFFNEKIELYIEKKDNNIVLYCKINAFKPADRVEVFYVIFTDINNLNYFLNFKNEVAKALDFLGLKLVFNKNTDNIIYKNISVFNDGSTTSPFKNIDNLSIDDIIRLINKRRHLSFKAGKINDIIQFSKELLKNPNNENISIYTGDNILEEGDIDIMLDKNIEMPFTITDKTKKIFDDHRNELERSKRNEIKRQAKSELRPKLVTNEIIAVENAIENMKRAGFSQWEIEKDPDIIEWKNNILNKVGSIGGKKYISSEDIPVEENKSMGPIMYMVVILTTFIVGIAIGMFIHNLGNFPGEDNFKVTPTPVPTITSTSPTTTPTSLATTPTTTRYIGPSTTIIPSNTNTNTAITSLNQTNKNQTSNKS